MTIVATYNQLHQLLEQSLRDFQAESSDLTDAQDQELSQALHRLTGRLTEILANTSESSPSDEFLPEKQATSPSPSIPQSLKKPQFNFVTSCEGVILMANDAMRDMLRIDMTRLGKVFISEYIRHEEWEIVHHQLLAHANVCGSLDMVMTILPSGGPSQKVDCVVTPMVDHSLQVTAWHWVMTPEREHTSVQSFARLVQTLDAQLFGGQCLDECLRQICEGLVRTFQLAFVWIATVCKENVQLRAHAVTQALDWESHGPVWWTEVSRQEGLVRACGASEVFHCNNGQQSGDIAWFPPDFNLYETLCIPLAPQGPIPGVLVVCSEKPQLFDDSMKGWLRALGYQIDRFIARGCQLEQWRLHSAAIDSVNDAVCVTDLQGRLEWVNEAYAALLGDSPQQMLGSLLKSFPHEQLQGIRPPLSHSSDKTLWSVKTEIMQTGRNGESLVLEQVVSPLMNKEGHLTHFVAILHDVTIRKTQELVMKYQAHHDPLTDLPNRIMFEDRLQQGLAHARRNGTLLALFFLDLDNFKSINDHHGHTTGDRVLRVVAKRLGTCVRSTDTVARLCGDEFTVILQGLDRIQDIRQVAQKILECLTPPVRLGGQDIPIQISIGIAVYPKDSTDAHRLLEIADHSMYRAKDRGGQCWYFATNEWNAE